MYVDSFIKGLPQSDIIHADICDEQQMYRLMSAYKVRAIINLAAIVGDPACAKYPREAERTNVQGVASLLSAARRAGTVQKFVQASSCSVYGFNEQQVDETSPLNPLSLYAAHKIKAEQFIQASGIPYAILRFATACGWSPSPRFDLTVNEFARDAKLGRTIQVYRKDDWRPYCHVRDLAAVLRQAALPNSTLTGIYNVGQDSNNKTKQMLIEAIGKQLPVLVDYVQNAKTDADKRNYKVKFDRLWDALSEGTAAFLTVEDAIADVMEAVGKGGIDADDIMYRSDHLNI